MCVKLCFKKVYTSRYEKNFPKYCRKKLTIRYLNKFLTMWQCYLKKFLKNKNRMPGRRIHGRPTVGDDIWDKRTAPRPAEVQLWLENCGEDPVLCGRGPWKLGDQVPVLVARDQTKHFGAGICLEIGGLSKFGIFQRFLKIKSNITKIDSCQLVPHELFQQECKISHRNCRNWVWVCEPKFHPGRYYYLLGVTVWMKNSMR